MFWEQAELLALPVRVFDIYRKSVGQKLHSGSPTKRNVIHIYIYIQLEKEVHLYARSITSNRYTTTDVEIYYVKC